LGVPIEHPVLLVLTALLAILLFASLGLIVGIYAQTWDHNAFVQNLVIQPLTFVAGVFYSVDILPSPWHELSHANPLFYIVGGIRYGFLGTSDVAPALAISVTDSLAEARFGRSDWLIRSVHQLNPWDRGQNHPPPLTQLRTDH